MFPHTDAPAAAAAAAPFTGSVFSKHCAVAATAADDHLKRSVEIDCSLFVTTGCIIINNRILTSAAAAGANKRQTALG